MSGPVTPPDPLTLLAWSRVWSPLPSVEEQENTWQSLGIPLDFHTHQAGMISSFHAAHPTPPVPLQLHAALGMDGGECRELFVRIMHHLALDWDSPRLPPDHLALTCELLACAVHHDDPVLVEGLLERFLLPWCSRADQRLGGKHPLASLPALFRNSLVPIAA